jgi:hypothetical protein
MGVAMLDQDRQALDALDKPLTRWLQRMIAVDHIVTDLDIVAVMFDADQDDEGAQMCAALLDCRSW